MFPGLSETFSKAFKDVDGISASVSISAFNDCMFLSLSSSRVEASSAVLKEFIWLDSLFSKTSDGKSIKY